MTAKAAVLAVPASTATAVPYDYASTLTTPGWREGLTWPTAPAALKDIFRAGEAAYLDLIGGLADERLRRIAIMAAGSVLGRARPLIEAALACRNAAERGITFASQEPEIGFLQGGLAKPPPPRETGWLAAAAPPRRSLSRRIARTASWTPAWRLPAVIAAPHAVAVTHNALLRDVASADLRRIAFSHADAILAEARKQPVRLPDELGGLADTVASCLLAGPGLGEPYHARLDTLLRRQVGQALEEAARDVCAAETIARLPSELWSGTAGYPPARALGLEVMRRGGDAIRFDHAGSAGLVRADAGFVLRELAASSRFVTAPPGIANSVRRAAARAPNQSFGGVKIQAHWREPHLCDLDLEASRPPTGRRSVLYAPTIFRGFRQTAFGIIPDPVYLDWQLRFAEMLVGLPVELLCKPHPEGLLRGAAHPLEQVARVNYRPFETVMGDVDAFVFDRCQSTTFWTALCTDRPVVLIDLGITEFEPAVDAALKRRIRIVEARFDERNLPHVDAEALAQAVAGGAERVDPTEVRALLAGGQYDVNQEAGPQWGPQ